MMNSKCTAPRHDSSEGSLTDTSRLGENLSQCSSAVKNIISKTHHEFELHVMPGVGRQIDTYAGSEQSKRMYLAHVSTLRFVFYSFT
eukprot:scaffold8400_cov213-Skeletonema_marinoi.AAC.3